MNKLEQFSAKMFDTLFEAFCEGHWEIEVNDLITENAVAAGLVECVDFDPKVHDDPEGACMAGDPFYIITEAGREARKAARGDA